MFIITLNAINDLRDHENDFYLISKRGLMCIKNMQSDKYTIPHDVRNPLSL